MVRTTGDKRSTRVTLQTIADRLGVSRTTVSNAYGRPDQLAPELRDRILAAADELGYCGPDPVARTLRRGKSGAFALLMTESLGYAVTDPAAVLLLEGIAAVFDQEGHSLLILPAAQGREATLESARTAVVDGCIAYTAAEDDPRLDLLLRRRLPIVVVDGPDREGVAFVGVDNWRGAEQIAAHVAAQGHRNIAVISFPLAEDDWAGFVDPERQSAATFQVSRERLLGFRDGWTAAGHDWSRVPVFECRVNEPELGAKAASVLLSQPPRPSALLCFSDQLAIGAIAEAKRQGLSIPGDVSVTGYDDIPAAGMSDPPLTTVRQPLREKGTAAAQLLLAGWEQGQPPRRMLTTNLMVRASTGPATGE